MNYSGASRWLNDLSGVAANTPFAAALVALQSALVGTLTLAPYGASNGSLVIAAGTSGVVQLANGNGYPNTFFVYSNAADQGKAVLATNPSNQQ